MTKRRRRGRDPLDLGSVTSFAVTDKYASERREGKMGPHRSQMFTWTTKVHAPSWSMPAVGTCPGVCGVEKKAPRDIKHIPRKCLGCYAFNSGKYGTPGVLQATHRRWGWFDAEPEAKVVDRLVEAIKESGRETCRHQPATSRTPWAVVRKKDEETGKVRQRWSREDPLKCRKDTHGMPERFRIFDAGDFHNARAVRIWRQVAGRLPRVRFWAPTTAWVHHGVAGEGDLAKELAKLSRMPNVALKPSGMMLDEPAVKVNLGGAKATGTTVVSWRKEKREVACPWRGRPSTKRCERTVRVLPAATTLDGRPVVFDPDDDASRPEKILIKGKEHYLCKGDCAKCQRCWEKDVRVTYVQHGPDARSKEQQLKRGASMLKYLELTFPQHKDIGPEGSMAHPAHRFLTSREFLDPYEAEQRKRARTRRRKAALKRKLEAK